MWRSNREKAIWAAALVVFLAATGAPAAQDNEKGCPDTPQIETGQQAFDAFCGRCHTAEASARWFSDYADIIEAEAGLATYLDRHGPCPHDRHEAIAAYLRKVAGR